jgi:hypothetical protein
MFDDQEASDARANALVGLQYREIEVCAWYVFHNLCSYYTCTEMYLMIDDIILVHQNEILLRIRLKP